MSDEKLGGELLGRRHFCHAPEPTAELNQQIWQCKCGKRFMCVGQWTEFDPIIPKRPWFRRAEWRQACEEAHAEARRKSKLFWYWNETTQRADGEFVAGVVG